MFCLISATNASDAASGVGEIRTHAYDRYQFVRMVKRTRTGNQARNIDVLQPGRQFDRCRQTAKSFFT